MHAGLRSPASLALSLRPIGLSPLALTAHPSNYLDLDKFDHSRWTKLAGLIEPWKCNGVSPLSFIIRTLIPLISDSVEMCSETPLCNCGCFIVNRQMWNLTMLQLCLHISNICICLEILCCKVFKNWPISKITANCVFHVTVPYSIPTTRMQDTWGERNAIHKESLESAWWSSGLRRTSSCVLPTVR